MMKYCLSILLAFLIAIIPFSSFSAIAATVIEFEGYRFRPIEIKPSSDSGLDEVYIIYDAEELTISYNAIADTSVKFFTFDRRGISFASPIQNIQIINEKYTFNVHSEDCGYIIEDSDKIYRFWIINYSDNPFDIISVERLSETDCDATYISLDGSGRPIAYYTALGRREVISRDIILSYNTLEFDNDSHQYIQIEKQKYLPSLSEKISIEPPVYCNTSFSISGDRFLKEWGSDVTVSSEPYLPEAVDVCGEILLSDNTDKDNSNTIPVETDALGGSAPLTVAFTGYATDAASHTEWQLSSDENFENITHRFIGNSMEYTFTKEGTSYARFKGSTDSDKCESISQTFKFLIGESLLKIPNAFSPNGDGINDVWKVAYRSLIDFDCKIFDKHGHEVFHFTNPDSGWDGKRNGKDVSCGVYFYVLTATGTDGKRYNKSGDINIIYSDDRR